MERIISVRNEIKALIGEGLDIALKRLGDEISPESPRYDAFIQIKSRYSAYLNLTIRGGTAQHELDLTYNAITASFLTFLNALQEQDLKPGPPDASAKAGRKRGELLYNIPHQMQENREHRCAVRIAYLEGTLFDNWIASEGDVRRNIRVAEVMAVEILNVGGDKPFEVRPVSETVQFLEEDEITEWIFYVRPLMRGEFPLLLKVSVIEVINGREARKDVVIEERVIVSNAAEETPVFKKSGIEVYRGEQPRGEEEFLPRKRASNRGLRALAIFLAVVVGAPSATWALNPALYDYAAARLRNTQKAYEDYKNKYKGTDSPYLQDAYIRKAGKSENPQDYREYLNEFGDKAEFKQEVVQALKTLEVKQVQTILQNPADAQSVRRFIVDFPDSERYMEIKTAVETRAPAPVKEVLLPEIKAASLRSLQLAPTTPKVRQVLETYPETRAEVKKTIDTAPAEVKSEALPLVDKAYAEAVKNEPDDRKALEAARDYLQTFERPEHLDLLEKEMEARPLLRKKLAPEVKKAAVKMEAVNRQTPNETPTQTDKKTDETPAVSTDMTTNEPPAPSSKPVGAEPAKEDTKDLPDIPKFVMVPVEGGTFTMGQPDPNISCEGCSSDECPHEVTVRSFEIGKYEVTQKQWRQVMGDNPSSFKNCDDCPVEKVSWDDVQRFLDALNARLPRGQKKYRLPTEAEWEYAARGGKRSKSFTYAGANELGKVAWYDGNSGGKTHPVGQLAPNELVIFDMSGNVYEWCDDTWGPYPCDTKTKKESSRRVVRGGSWSNNSFICRSTNRDRFLTDYRFYAIGVSACPVTLITLCPLKLLPFIFWREAPKKNFKSALMAQTNETILQKAYDLLKHGILVVEQFPRKHKYTLGDRLQNNLSDVLEVLIEAYYVPANRKRTLLERANILLEQSRHYCRLCYELGLFNSIKYEDLARRLNEVGRMNGGWLKTIA